MQQLGGIETEYALVDESHSRNSLQLVKSLMDAARGLVHLPGYQSTGIFVQNGSRIYADTGNHLELATPESENPLDVVRYGVAGDRIVAELGERCNVAIFKHCVDYSGTGATWGPHESYSYRSPARPLMHALIPHLASRVIYTGPGGLNCFAWGIEYQISPRALFVVKQLSENTTGDRGICNTRDEPLASPPLARLHLTCGDSVQSHTAAYLRIGATMLVIALIDGGVKIKLALKRPVQAMHMFSADLSCLTAAETTDGRSLSAVDLQREYLQRVRAHLDRDFMPSWAPSVCDLWERTLDDLSHDPGRTSEVLDWSIKLSLMRAHAARRGWTVEKIRRWGGALRSLRAATHPDSLREHQVPPPTPALEGFIRSLRLASETAPIFDRIFSRAGIDPDELGDFFKLRSELCELDLRYCRVGDTSIFASLDRAGVLRHQVPGMDGFERAMSRPPRGRARYRGVMVRRLARRGGHAAAEWNGVWDMVQRRHLDLNDPFCPRPKWKPLAEPQQQQQRRPSFEAAALHERARVAYREGDLEKAYQLVESMTQMLASAPLSTSRDFLRLRAWVHARCGRGDAVSILDRIHAGSEPGLSVIGDYLQVLRYGGLVPQPGIERWVTAAQELLPAMPAGSPQSVVTIEYCAHASLASGRAQEAADLFQLAYEQERLGQNDSRIVGRVLAGQGEAHRRLGRDAEAAEHLTRAHELQMAGGFLGDLAGQTLPSQAKLASEASLAEDILAEAKVIQRRLGDCIGLTRSYLLIARIATSRWRHTTCRRTARQLSAEAPALQSCPLYIRITTHWREWAGKNEPDDCGDRFWGL